MDLRIHDVGFLELLKKSSLVCLVCALAILLRSDDRILSTSRLKALIRPNSFGPTWQLLPTGRIITLRALDVKGQQKSSVSHCPSHNVRQHSENASETSIWRARTASNHEIHLFSS